MQSIRFGEVSDKDAPQAGDTRRCPRRVKSVLSGMDTGGVKVRESGAVFACSGADIF